MLHNALYVYSIVECYFKKEEEEPKSVFYSEVQNGYKKKRKKKRSQSSSAIFSVRCVKYACVIIHIAVCG